MALLYEAELTPSKLELIEGWAPSQPWFEGKAGLSEAGLSQAVLSGAVLPTAHEVDLSKAGLTNVAAFRFDDPEGEVGIETVLVRSGDGPLHQVALTYRGEPLEGGDAWLIDTMEHSVLGHRWVYDATGDPVYINALATAILTGGHQADLVVDIDGHLVPRAPTALVHGQLEHGLLEHGLLEHGLLEHSALWHGAPWPGSKADAPARETRPGIAGVRTRHEQGVTYIDAGDLHLAVSRVLPTSADAVALRQAAQDSAMATIPHSVAGSLRATWLGQREPLEIAWLLG